MLAASRNDRVINRTEILKDSVSTRNGFNHSGAPLGRRWAIKDFGAWVKALIIKLNHRGRPMAKVNTKCLEDLNTYGRRPIKFKAISKRNKGTKIIGNPFKWRENVRVVWDIMISVGKDSIHEYRLFEVQRDGWNRVTESRDKDQKVVGEKDE